MSTRVMPTTGELLDAAEAIAAQVGWATRRERIRKLLSKHLASGHSRSSFLSFFREAARASSPESRSERWPRWTEPDVQTCVSRLRALDLDDREVDALLTVMHGSKVVTSPTGWIHSLSDSDVLEAVKRAASLRGVTAVLPGGLPTLGRR